MAKAAKQQETASKELCIQLVLDSLDSDECTKICSQPPKGAKNLEEKIKIVKGSDPGKIYATLEKFSKNFFKRYPKNEFKYVVKIPHEPELQLAYLCMSDFLEEKILSDQQMKVWKRIKLDETIARAFWNFFIEQHDLKTKSESFMKILEKIFEAAFDSGKILLLGEIGVGKTFIADVIYRFKKRIFEGMTGDFVPVNCAELQGSLVESTLFGIQQAADVKTPFRGALERANDGVLFLDEVGELIASRQAQLLTAIDTGNFSTADGGRQVTSKFQLITATSRNLKTEVNQGEFSPALFSRISKHTIELPSLEDRKDDIDFLFDVAVKKYKKENDRIKIDENSTKKFKEEKEEVVKWAKTQTWKDNNRGFFNAMDIIFGHYYSQSGKQLKTLKEILNNVEADLLSNQDSSSPNIQTVLDDKTEKLLQYGILFRCTAKKKKLGEGKESDEKNKTNEKKLPLEAEYDMLFLKRVIKICSRKSKLAEVGRILRPDEPKGSNYADHAQKILRRYGLKFDEEAPLHVKIDETRCYSVTKKD